MPKRADAPIMPVCKNCGCALGEEAGEWPITISDDDGDGKGKRESWCGQCFVFVRAMQDPGRWHWQSIRACRCDRCGLKQADFGIGKCASCKAKLPMLILGPKIAGTQIATAEVRVKAN